jgi:hypothetical protein
MHYHVIFDVTQTGFRQWQSLATALVSATVPILIVWYKGLTWVRSLTSRGLFLLFSPLWICLIGSLGFFTNYPNYRHLQSAMRNSECEVTEGMVTGFHKRHAFKGNNVVESFMVNGRQFSFGTQSSQNGFQQGGIIHDGLQVRIFYYDKDSPNSKDITRLEIAQ